MAYDNGTITRMVGTADAFALMAAGFTFPSPELAEALVNGTFQADLEISLVDMGVGSEEAARMAQGLRDAASGMDSDALLDAMRVDYSSLYYGLGRFRIMSPYESVFKKLAVNPTARATAFLTRSTHDVEDAMRKRSALPENARREPADHFATELDFMRHLFTGVAAALSEGDETLAAEWRSDAERFYKTHVSPWIPDLLHRSVECAQQQVYRELARAGLAVLDCVDQLFA